MSNATGNQAALPHRGSTRLEGEPGAVAAADLLRFAESLVREAASPSQVTGATLHVLGPGASTSVTGDAHCIWLSDPSVWRVSVADAGGTPMAEVTLTVTAKEKAVPAPPDKPRKSAASDDRRTRIATAARDVFAEKGYASATMREIAAAADMHVPTMYQYFRSKEEILELVYSWTINQAVDLMQDALEGTAPVEQRIDQIIRRLHDVNLKLRRGTLVMNRETRSLSRTARDRVLGHYAGMVEKLGDVIAEGQAEGIFREMDPQLAAVFVDALADVWVLRPFAVRDKDSEDYAAELVAFVRNALMGNADMTPETPGQTVTNRRN
ncbi:TetR family transcriptional regulator [Rhodobacteraceae bacterium 2CG4]|uniref:TetR family transcriptional regulator n=1 Tax=Halovulum marinum TaxID=2662447 RepID=A0A6L5Z2Y9_9RHOB|nr:TetR/AcrR family transcriptional regulator [Halovulum marinum]MSU90926.1 TetR family transcriptional regulator [Halovulum marinum]